MTGAFDQAAKSAVDPLSVACTSSTSPGKLIHLFFVLTMGIGHANPFASRIAVGCCIVFPPFIGVGVYFKAYLYL